MKYVKIAAILVTAALLLSACGGSTREVSRIDTKEVVDLSGRWNDSDARFVAEDMVQDVLSRIWLNEFLEKNGKKPVLVVGKVRNKSSEHIATDVFIKDIERELINSGKVKFVASQGERDDIREERRDQNEFASKDSFKKFYKELGADYLMSGVINSVTDSYEGKRVILYQVDLELWDIETNEKVWIGSKEIKKYIAQDSYKM